MSDLTKDDINKLYQKNLETVTKDPTAAALLTFASVVSEIGKNLAVVEERKHKSKFPEEY